MALFEKRVAPVPPTVNAVRWDGTDVTLASILAMLPVGTKAELVLTIDGILRIKPGDYVVVDGNRVSSESPVRFEAEWLLKP